MPINIVQEQQFYTYIQHYLNQFDAINEQRKSANMPEKEYLFKITPQYAWRIVNKHTTYFCHLMRHTRASHLASPPYNFSDSELREFFGWASAQMSARYVHLSMDNIKKKMKIK